MKFKALRKKTEPKEFVIIDTIASMMILYTSDLPKPQPLTATIEGLKEYYKNSTPLPDQTTLDDLELVEFEMYEADTIGANIRNKLSPPKTLVSLLEEYFSANIAHATPERAELYILIKKEMEQTKINIKYIADLL